MSHKDIGNLQCETELGLFRLLKRKLKGTHTYLPEEVKTIGKALLGALQKDVRQ